ncbi:SLBB domain-containing protein [Undibacterium sp. SXout20W]|uniref:SLBB domain-containing protein n=1 Tax=Undibacterium sp. SXout20W TaxID=3413051 RepID=UPI003BF3F4E9
MPKLSLKFPGFCFTGAFLLLFSVNLMAQEAQNNGSTQLKIEQSLTGLVAASYFPPVANMPATTTNNNSDRYIATVKSNNGVNDVNPVVVPVNPVLPATTVVPVETQAAPVTNVVAATVKHTETTEPQNDVVGEGDQLLVTVFGQPDLSADIIVGANGSITLPLVGTIDVKGKTGAEVAAAFANKLQQGQYLVNPKVSVKVAQQVSRSFSVLGEVARPGRFILQGTLSVLDALSLAGGVTPRADKNLKVLRRAGQDGKAELVEYASIHLDFDSDKSNGQFMQKVLPNDVLIVGQLKNFYVYGEVRRPGSYPMEDDLNVMRVISIGGGVTDRGSTSRIIIHRKLPGGELKEISARISDVVLPGDVVFINERIF